MKIHFVAIGGSAMHNLAIALKLKGVEVSGSDDEIFEPAKSRLEKHSLLPEKIGWQPEKINNDLDAVILGMHAKQDNPELLKAKELGLKIYSYPEYLYQASKDKTRIVVGGSHGKTTITAMILHVMQTLGIETDYMVGAKLEGFDVMVKMSDAKYMVLEGDEYLSSPMDLRPKFHLYKPDIAIINGIAWDHINVFPTFEIYVEQFKIFADKISENGSLIYFQDDENICKIAKSARKDIKTFPYREIEHKIVNNQTIVVSEGKEYPLQIFGKHNLINLNAAMKALEQIGVKKSDFLSAITSFKGASKRLEIIKNGKNQAFYSDFAHSPSKLKATVEAMKSQYAERKLTACMELHTFSSLTKEFLVQYKGTINAVDNAAIYFNSHALELKRLPNLDKEMIYQAFEKDGLQVFTTTEEVVKFIKENSKNNENILMMSSSNFGGLDLKQLANEIITE
jgi:UDP-N-acetylmuramate: L-alanyl-gamma-D-glutamyl-meso-diaminopimelate ligase